MPRSQAELARLLPPLAESICGRPSNFESCTIQTLKGDASSRRYHRILIPGGNPASLVVMELPPDAASSEEAGKAVSVPTLPFINVLEYLQAAGVRVPKLYEYLEHEGFLLLEDLGDKTFESLVRASNRSETVKLYEDAVSLLIDFQQRTEKPSATCIAFSRTFDETLLLWELHHFREWLLEHDRQAALGAAERNVIESQFKWLARTLAAIPPRLVHRDFQSRNLMVHNGRLAVIDFQDALLGPPLYDLVALLRDSYIELKPFEVEHLLHYYCEKTRAEDFDAIKRQFYLQTVQRKLKDAGRFIFIDRVKKNPGFLSSVPSSLRYVAQAFAQVPELHDLQAILAQYVPELSSANV